MLQDYEIIKTKTRLEKVMPYIEFIIVLIIIQSLVTLFTTGPVDEESIRFRLLAHSDAPADQQVKEAIQREIAPLINNAVNKSQTKEELGDNLAALETSILEVANSMANGMTVTLERSDALFPAKRSGFVVHPQAAYDAYILTIGSGRGDNWWCALFPKLCFPDKTEKEEEEEVTFFVWEWIKGLFA
ncbi:stage II sporulation protein R [Filibacter tadaridae]|uniref:Stage II sporulation protein R (Spore_II_R) n=1 Tax=Filibacter tadaridae TaxID=2483811 RepID=A0A3P5WX11_9BACL|nr:stage II sporulation protein R [Filibacter tadaridae]VDC19413.1 Stage II sporulation protein R (spore_II_R) [Filibacter tadaridae]